MFLLCGGTSSQGKKKQLLDVLLSPQFVAKFGLCYWERGWFLPGLNPTSSCAIPSVGSDTNCIVGTAAATYGMKNLGRILRWY